MTRHTIMERVLSTLLRIRSGTYEGAATDLAFLIEKERTTPVITDQNCMVP